MVCGHCLDAMDAGSAGCDGGNGSSVVGVNVRGAPSSVGGDGVGVASGVGKAVNAASTSASACTGSKARVRPNAAACLLYICSLLKEIMISIFENGKD